MAEKIEEKLKCVYKSMQESGHSIFEHPAQDDEDLKRCIACEGYDSRCSVYLASTQFMAKAHMLREKTKREMEDRRRDEQ